MEVEGSQGQQALLSKVTDELLFTTKMSKSDIRIKDLLITKKIGINPLAGLYQSTITCTKCGPGEALKR